MCYLNNIGLDSQKGVSLVGNLIVLVAIVFFGIVGLKFFPAYSEFYSLKGLLNAMNKAPLSSMSKREIVAEFDRLAVGSYVSAVSGKDLIIESDSDKVKISVNYKVVKPIVANVSMMVDFETSNLDQ